MMSTPNPVIWIIVCPYLLFVWPHKGVNPVWSFIWGQSLCLQWHHKCLGWENNGWWILGVGGGVEGTVDRRDKTSSVMESFQERHTYTLDKHHALKNAEIRLLGLFQGRDSGSGGGGGEGLSAAEASGYNTHSVCVCMELCDCWRQSEMWHCSLRGEKEKKEALFL